MANVKHTTNNGERLTTNCKRVATALKRFATYLNEYDRYYNEMLNNIKSATDNNTTTFTDDRYNTITMTLTVNDSNDNYTLTIKHTHNETTDSTNKDNVTISLGSLDDVKIDLSQESNKTPAELKAEINKKYCVNAVYYDTDSVLCDAEKQNVCVYHNTTTDNEVYATTKIIIRDVCDNNEVCTITPYENGKELTTPIPKMKCLTCVIDYVKRLYALKVVTRETYFNISRVGKRNVVLTYTNTHNIVQYYNISAQMQSLATTAIEQYGYYSKYVRKPLKSRQYDVLELYKKGIYLTISQCNDDENVIKNWYCDITYKSVHHIGQYTYKELLHLIDNIRYNTQEYCDKYFD